MSKKNKKIQENTFNNPAKSSPDVKKIKAEKKPQRKAEKKVKRIKKYGIFFNVLHGLVSLAFLVLLYMLNVLPLTYHLIITAVVAVLFAITAASQKGKRAARVIGRIYSILIMLILLCGSSVLGVANYLLDTITGAPLEKKEQEFDLMSGSGAFSITEDAFGILVKDLSDKTKEAESLYVVNPDTRQMLSVVTPTRYYVTIPKVSEGQREQIGKAWEYGPEASIAAYNNLYETELSYYLQLDSDWTRQTIERFNELFVAMPTWEQVQELGMEILNIEEHIKTSLSKYEVQQLIKAEFGKESDWAKTTKLATGVIEEAYTFSSPDSKVSVLVPESDVVEEIIDLIDRVEDGEILKKNTSDVSEEKDEDTADAPVIVIP